MTMRRTVLSALLWFLSTLLFTFPAGAEQAYQQPPREILEVLSAPAPPAFIPSPTGRTVLLARPLYHPPISDLAEPMLRLAGVRITPRNNGLHDEDYYVGYALLRLPGGPEVPVELPAGTRLGEPLWNAAGTSFAFSNKTDSAVELWVCDAATARARRVDGLRLNPVLEYGIAWMPDQATLLVKTVPAGRSAPPAPAAQPSGPRIEESGKVTAASSTYEARDLLATPHDADLFEHYATAQLALVDAASGRVTRIGEPGVLAKVLPAPGGRFLLVERIERPYSYQRSYVRFPVAVEVWDAGGRRVETVARLPLAEQVPIHGVRTGPRDHDWRATAPATLVWAEALDDGDTFKPVPHHDRVLLQAIDRPGAKAREWLRTEHRFAGAAWIEGGGLALVTDFDEDHHQVRTVVADADGAAAPRPLWSRSFDDFYGDPGSPVFRELPGGGRAVRVHQGAIFLAGRGASPAGDRPFLDRLDLASLKTERLFRSGREELEAFVGWVDPAQATFLTRRESPTRPRNVWLRTLGQRLPPAAPAGEAGWRSTALPLTRLEDPTPQLRRLSKRLVTYRRPDGVELSFTLYLPPGYQPGTRLPTIIWAYPLDYTEARTAGQVFGSPLRFTTLFGPSPVFLALAGYAVLDQTAMPVVGPTESAYDSFVEQIVANAKAAIDKAVELGVTDRERVGVIGHSHGALMTANLLVWSDLFRAGIARSGAYNHTLRPFGFQNERRTLYRATETYMKLSPLLHADRVRSPLLLIHGERDANPGTVPLQSEKLFEALRGVGATTRLVILPFESHGYSARESVEHTLYEMVAWFDRYVKNAPPREQREGAAAKTAAPTRTE
jgi:dipeptidyl aminopeptidase/acylaminoacyl peptidase